MKTNKANVAELRLSCGCHITITHVGDFLIRICKNKVHGKLIDKVAESLADLLNKTSIQFSKHIKK